MSKVCTKFSEIEHFSYWRFNTFSPPTFKSGEPTSERSLGMRGSNCSLPNLDKNMGSS